jgi:putative oxidoreductase
VDASGKEIIVHFPHGFFMNWFGKLPAGQEGFEYHLLVIGICAALIFQGGGNLSIDKLIENVMRSK